MTHAMLPHRTTFAAPKDTSSSALRDMEIEIKIKHHWEEKQYTQVLRWAYDLILYAPTYSAGYLWAANVYRRQYDYERAAAIYKSGIVQQGATAMDDPLRRGLAMAESCLQNKADPITRLPPEIIAYLFEYYCPEKRIVATLVSRTWRIALLSLPVWRRLILSRRPSRQGEGTKFDFAEFMPCDDLSHGYWRASMIQALQKQLRELAINTVRYRTDDDDTYWVAKLYKHEYQPTRETSCIKKQECPITLILRWAAGLDIKVDENQQIGLSDIETREPISQDISSTRLPYLTTLHIHTSVRPNGDTLRLLLTICPQLVILSYRTDWKKRLDTPAWIRGFTFGPAATLKLENLSWSESNHILDDVLFLKRCPRLRSLTAYSYDFWEESDMDISNACTALQKYCPQLQELRFLLAPYDHDEDIYDVSLTFDFPADAVGAEKEGIRIFEYALTYGIDPGVLMALLKKSQATISRVSFGNLLDAATVSEVLPLARAQSLYWALHREYTADPKAALRMVLPHCPNLQSIKADIILTEPMGALQFLRAITFNHHCDSQNVFDLVNILARQGDACSVRHVSMDSDAMLFQSTDVSECLFVTLGGISTLEKITVAGNNRHLVKRLDAIDLVHFEERAQQSGLVASLKELDIPVQIKDFCSIRIRALYFSSFPLLDTLKLRE